MVLVRRLSEEEIPSAYRLVRDIYSESGQLYFPDNTKAQAEALRLDVDIEDMLDEATLQGSLVLGAWLDGQLCGSAAARLEGGASVFLYRCYVSRPGEGVGGELMTARLQWAAEQGAIEARLEVAANNQQGRRHALRHGFEVLSERSSSVDPSLSILIYSRNL